MTGPTPSEQEQHETYGKVKKDHKPTAFRLSVFFFKIITPEILFTVM